MGLKNAKNLLNNCGIDSYRLSISEHTEFWIQKNPWIACGIQGFFVLKRQVSTMFRWPDFSMDFTIREFNVRDYSHEGYSRQQKETEASFSIVGCAYTGRELY